MQTRATLEVNITTRCQNRCACCSHAIPWAKPYDMPPAVLARDLAALTPVLRVRQFFLLGGEPLLHRQLPEMLDIANTSPISDEVCILTNGQLLDRCNPVIFDKIDFLRVSCYPGKLDPDALQRRLEPLAAKHGFGFGIDRINLFFRQFDVSVNGSHFGRCPWRERCLTVHDGYLFLCPAAAFFPERFMGLAFGTDGLCLHPCGGLRETELQGYLDRTTPFVTCRICHSFKEQSPWKESADFSEWVKDSTVTKP